MAVPFSNTKLRVPRGFQNLLEGLAREVLRSQPDELYEFGAQYFENLIKQREESGIDPTEHGAKMEDRFYNNKAFSQPEVDPSDPNQQDAALAIQTKYRQHAAKQEVEVIREEKAATKIQAGFRGHQGRTDAQDETEAKTEEDQVPKPAEEEIDIDLTDPDVEAAAVKIQASFKGFQTRKTMKSAAEKEETTQHQPEPSSREKEPEVDIDLNDPDVEKAAVKIQAGFKGMRARQEVRSMKESEGTTAIQAEYEMKVARESPVQTRSVVQEADMCSAPEPEEPVMPMAELHEKVDSPVLTQPLILEQVKCSAPEPEELVAEEQEVDIDLNDPQVEQAAVKIQAGFKGMQARKEVKQKREEREEKKAAVVSPAKQEPTAEAIDIDFNDPEVESAAIKIQAGFKGMKTRQELKQRNAEQKGSAKSSIPETSKTPVADETAAEVAAEAAEEKTTTPKPAEEELDIDLDDPEVHAAAVKIQAGFKGHKTRRDMSAKKSASQSPTDGAKADEEVKAAEDEATQKPDTEAADTTGPAAQPAAETESAKEDVAAEDTIVAKPAAEVSDSAPEAGNVLAAEEAAASAAQPEATETTAENSKEEQQVDPVPSAEQAAAEPADDAAVETAAAPADAKPADTTSADAAPADAAPADAAPADAAPADAAPADAAPADAAPADAAPADAAPADAAPADAAPADAAPAESAADSAPAPADATPAEPAKEETSDQTATSDSQPPAE